jgi:thymidylate synthase
MRIFKNCTEMLSEVHRDLFEMGVKVTPKTMQDKTIAGESDYATLEVSGYSFAILGTKDLDKMIEIRGLNLDWCYADLKERLSEDKINPGEAYKLRQEWAEFVHNGEFAYTYNERIRYQLKQTIDVLKFDKDSRQAVLTIYEGTKDSGNRSGLKRVPCSMYYQFLVREGKLDCIYSMRSSDFMTHFPYDIWMAAKLRDHIAEQIEVPVGKLIFFSGSLHAYQKDIPETF